MIKEEWGGVIGRLGNIAFYPDKESWKEALKHIHFHSGSDGLPDNKINYLLSKCKYAFTINDYGSKKLELYLIAPTSIFTPLKRLFKGYKVLNNFGFEGWLYIKEKNEGVVPYNWIIQVTKEEGKNDK